MSHDMTDISELDSAMQNYFFMIEAQNYLTNASIIGVKGVTKRDLCKKDEFR